VSGKATGWVLENGPADKTLCSLLVAFADAADVNGDHSRPGMDRLVRTSRLSESYIRRLIPRLLREGWLERTDNGGGRGHRAEFRILMGRPPADPSSGARLAPRKGARPKAVHNPVGNQESAREARAFGEAEMSQGARPGARLVEDVSSYGFNGSKGLPCTGGESEGGTNARLSSPPVLVAVPTEAERLCDVLAERIGAHWGKSPKRSGAWPRDMDLLLRRGPVSWAEPDTIAGARVERVVDGIFTRLATPAAGSTFCWANQIRSPGNLRQHWERLVQELNATLAAPAPRRGFNRNAGAEAVLAELREAGSL
jgi:hypothetical protein